MEEELQQLRIKAIRSIDETASHEDLVNLEKSLIGKNGLLTALLKNIKTLPVDEKRVIGKMTNDLKIELSQAIEKRAQDIRKSSFCDLEKKYFDSSLPGQIPAVGQLHPLTTFIREIEDTFLSMNFDVAEGPEIEDEYHNFTALNIPEDHPARDMQDTLWAKDIPFLLRTHTSPVQIRHMESHHPPIRIICPGRVFRKDDVDSTHSPMFHQFEGLMIGPDITLSHLKGILTIALKRLISSDVELRFRSSYFPFVEPGLEVDVRSGFHKSGWLELLGCGMVHPNVLKSVGLDPNVFRGFAFGAGIERLLMIRHGINDIRLFYENDPRFLKQFSSI